MRRIGLAIAVLSSAAVGYCARLRIQRADAPNAAASPKPPASSPAEPETASPAMVESQRLDEQRCNWLLQETGVDIPGWRPRAVVSLAAIAAVALFVLGVASGTSGRPLLLTIGLTVFAGLGFVIVLQVTERYLVITETARSGLWPSAVRHLNRWLQLAGPRLFVSVLTLMSSVVFILWADRPNVSDLDRSIFSSIVGALWIISATSLVTILYEYRRQLRRLRRSAEPTIVSLRNDVPVPPEEVSRLLMSLSYGVAAPHTERIGLIDAARARAAIAIYRATLSPRAIAPIIDEAGERLRLTRPMNTQRRRRLSE